MVEKQPRTPPPALPDTPTRHRRPLHSISTRLILFGFLSTFLTALVVSWIAIDTLQNHLSREAKAHLPEALRQRAPAFDKWLADALGRLDEVASKNSWNAAQQPGKDRRLSAARLREIGSQLQTMLANSGGAFDWAALVDPSRGGVIVEVGGPRPATGVVGPAALGQTDPLRSESARLRTFRTTTGHPVALASAPVAAANGSAATRVRTRIVARVRLESLRPLLEMDVGHSSRALRIVDIEGVGVLAPNARRDAGVCVPPAALRRASTEGSARYEAHDGDWLASARALGSTDWLLLLEMPSERVFAPTLVAAQRIFLADIAIILLFSLLAYKITEALVQPIETLSEGAVRISEGELEHEIPLPRANDEIGFLTLAFNDMMGKLRQSQLEIEQDKIRLAERNEELQRANEVLAQLSITDGLTKLHNHRYFQDHLTREIKRTSRSGESLSMVLIDLDDFKHLNDRYGHASGDQMLVSIANIMNESVRESDLLARYGGEEFVILTPGTNLEGAVALAEKIRMAAEDSSQIVDDSMRPVRVTISCGVAQYSGDRKRFFRAADQALYRAKEAGKNCVVAADEEESAATA